MANKKDRTGETFESKYGVYVIIQYNGCYDCLVEFQDEHKYTTHAGYGSCKRGEVRNPYHATVRGHGYLGVLPNGEIPRTRDENGKIIRTYNLWENMLTRCYDEKFHEKYPAYKDCEVCERWLCYANFLEDLLLIDGYKEWLDDKELFEIDKDSKIKGNKLYSPETVMFIPKSDNLKEEYERNGNTFKTLHRPVIGTNIETGEEIKFDNISEAEKWCGKKGVGHCCKGRSKTCGGHYWRYSNQQEAPREFYTMG